MQKTLSALKDKINNALIVDRENHIYRCHRSIFTDPQLFEFEMKHIFEGNWVFLAHESQIAEPGDYYTLTLGRQPVIITRDKKNELHALINSCAHRGAMLCRRKTGNKNSFTCPFHGWTFSNNGKLLKAKDESTGAILTPSNRKDLTTCKNCRVFSLIAVSYSVASMPTCSRWRPISGNLQNHRSDRRPGAGGAGSAQGFVELCIRRQLEAGRGERRRWLSRQRGALELRLNHVAPQL
jgi:nitrite reductase/ring-hydroxylating ferredoxin subunit